MEKTYIQRIQERLPIMKQKLDELEKTFGRQSEQWNIANANYLEHKNLVKTGIPKNINQSIEIPYDLVEGF